MDVCGCWGIGEDVCVYDRTKDTNIRGDLQLALILQNIVNGVTKCVAVATLFVDG